MGATTENPYYFLIRPLLSLSRCRVLVLRPLRPHVAELLLKWAASASNNKGLIPKVWMPGMATDVVTLEDAKEALQCKHVASDKARDEHYNLISALH
ncbi:hypothetical protein ACFX1W_008269 [Malus domestica]